MDDSTKDQMREWVERWARVGPILEEERWSRLLNMSEEEAQRATCDLLELWQPGWTGDGGEGLLIQQRIFARGRQRG